MLRLITLSLLLVSHALILPTMATAAEWDLDNAGSRLHFVSTKAGSVAEVHRFRQLSGSVSADGQVQVLIDVSSVDTGIEARDQRMRDMLFRASDFPTASLDASVDLAAVEALAPGEVTTLASEAVLRVLDRTTPLTVELSVARLAEDRLLVSSHRPLIVNAGPLGLDEGVERLREVAGLPSISPAVPVTFQLTFIATP
jgi:polyisoprenoid-binding protein YceI